MMPEYKEVKRPKSRRYCCGLIFNYEMEKLILIKKKRPDWQVGLLNGVGGELYVLESGKAGMVRECREECGLDLAYNEWKTLACISGKDTEGDSYRCWFYYATPIYSIFNEAKTQTDEEIQIIDLTKRTNDLVCALEWLIPLAIYMENNPKDNIDL